MSDAHVSRPGLRGVAEGSAASGVVGRMVGVKGGEGGGYWGDSA